MNKKQLINALIRMNVQTPIEELQAMKVSELSGLFMSSIDRANELRIEQEKTIEELSRKNQARKNKAVNSSESRANVNARRWDAMIAIEPEQGIQSEDGIDPYQLFDVQDMIHAVTDSEFNFLFSEETPRTRVFSIVNTSEAIACGFSESQTREYIGDMRPSYSCGSTAITRGLLCYPLNGRKDPLDTIMKALDRNWILRDNPESLAKAKALIHDALQNSEGLEEWTNKKGKKVMDRRFVIFRLDPELLSHSYEPNRLKMIDFCMANYDLHADEKDAWAERSIADMLQFLHDVEWKTNYTEDQKAEYLAKLAKESDEYREEKRQLWLSEIADYFQLEQRRSLLKSTNDELLSFIAGNENAHGDRDIDAMARDFFDLVQNVKLESSEFKSVSGTKAFLIARDQNQAFIDPNVDARYLIPDPVIPPTLSAYLS
jgi:regulator of replication initiation timing